MQNFIFKLKCYDIECAFFLLLNFQVKSKGHILAVVDENGFIVIYNTNKTGQMAIQDGMHFFSFFKKGFSGPKVLGSCSIPSNVVCLVLFDFKLTNSELNNDKEKNRCQFHARLEMSYNTHRYFFIF